MLLKAIPKVEMDRAHVRGAIRRRRRSPTSSSERCDRNSYYAFSCLLLSCCLLCPFIFAFIVYTLNWLHFWHWRRKNMKKMLKEASGEMNEAFRKSQMRREPHQTHWRPDCEASFFFTVFLSPPRPRARLVDWSRIDKARVVPHYLRWAWSWVSRNARLAVLFLAFLGRLTHSIEKRK